MQLFGVYDQLTQCARLQSNHTEQSAVNTHPFLRLQVIGLFEQRQFTAHNTV
jgi:hypothetical protein